MKKLVSLLIAILICFSLTACKQEKSGFTFYCPDGAPALSIAKFIEDGEDFGTDKPFTYSVVSAKEINNAILKDSADFVIMPVNSATKLYKDNGKEDYKMVAVITHGNFYVMSKMEINSIDDLKGKVIYVPQSGKVPDLTLQASLKAKNIPYETGDVEKDGIVVLNYKYQEPSDIVKFMMASETPVVGLIPEPAATNLTKKGISYQLSLQDMFDENAKSYPQAVLMAKSTVIKDYPEIISAMADSFAGNVRSTESNPKNAVQAIKNNFESTSLSENLSTSAVYGCNIYWQGASVAKDKVNSYIERIRQVSPDFINVVEEDFYL